MLYPVIRDRLIYAVFVYLLLGKISRRIRIIEVKGPCACHAQDLAVFDVHHYAGRGFGAYISVFPFIQIFLDDILDRGVYGEHKIIPVRCRPYDLFKIGLIVQISVLPAVGAYEGAVIILLHSAGADGTV